MLVNKYNDQNIERGESKMSDHFTGPKNTNLSNTNDDSSYYQELNSDLAENINLPYDHIYATNDSKTELENSEGSCQNAESEVRFLKEWLLMHLDLIQQQNDDILSKEKTIFFLQQENEMLKEKIRCLEIGTPFQLNNFNNHKPIEYNHNSFSEDMTQDSGPEEEDNNDKTIDLEDLQKNCDFELLKYSAESDEEHCDQTSEENQESEITSHNLETVASEEVSSSDTVRRNSATESDSAVNYNNVKYVVSNLADCSGEVDSMKNLRMSIRRKRLCSNSSAFSITENSTDEKRQHRRIKKKRKHCYKDEDVLTTPDLYHTQAGDTSILPPTHAELLAEEASMTFKNLEVPHWRVKVYASCYSMEGTENLEDEVFNRRHSRLEIDERRRKRWDVQRIREQRIIEKLKQRQDRGSRAGDAEPVQSLWPSLEDVKYIELSPQLPVASLGIPIVKYSKMEFNLPWMNHPPIVIKKSKQMRRRRKCTKR